MNNWIIAIIAGIIGLCLSVTDCSGGAIGNLFESDAEIARAEADRTRETTRAAGELERIRTDNQIRLRQAQADIERQQALLVHQGLIQPPAPVEAGPPDIVYISIIVCLIWIGALTVWLVARAALRSRHGHYPAMMPSYSHRRTIIDDRGQEYRLIPMDDRQMERGAIR